MRLSPAVGLVLALVAGLICVRLGFWQLGRLEEKRALNRAQRAALATPPVPFDAERLAALPPDSLRVQRFALTGTFDSRRHNVLVSRAKEGEPGVEIVTPLAPASGGPLVMVDRGFLPSADGATILSEDLPEPAASATRTVVGFVVPLRQHDRPGFLTRAPVDSLEVWRAPWLNADSLRTALGAPVAPFVMKELPGPGVPEKPARAAPVPFDEALHLNYAVQWFSFAAIVMIGTIVLVTRSRRAKPVEDSQ